MPGLDAGGLQSPLLPANIFCALLLKPVTAFQWLQQLLWIKWSMSVQMFVMQQESSPSCIAIWWARAGVCTADPVSACCCTSSDLVQCRGKGGRGTTGIRHCSSACWNMQPHCPLHSYVCLIQLYNHLGAGWCWIEFFKQPLRKNYPTCCNFGPCKCNRETVSYPQHVCKLCARAGKANTWRQSKLSDRFFQKRGTWAHMRCWWLFLHHHAHTYPSVKGNELSSCKISSQSLLFTHRDEQKYCVKATRMMRCILNLP